MQRPHLQRVRLAHQSLAKQTIESRKVQADRRHGFFPSQAKVRGLVRAYPFPLGSATPAVPSGAAQLASPAPASRGLSSLPARAFPFPEPATPRTPFPVSHTPAGLWRRLFPRPSSRGRRRPQGRLGCRAIFLEPSTYAHPVAPNASRAATQWSLLPKSW